MRDDKSTAGHACTRAQAFTDGAMRSYLPIIMDVVEFTLDKWAGGGETVKFYSGARSFAFDVAATVLTGTRFDGDQLGCAWASPLSWL